MKCLWKKHKLESRLLGEISITSDTQMSPPLWQKVKSLLMKVKEESEKVGLNSTFRKQRSWHLVPSLHGNRWGSNGNRTGFIWGGSKITADHDFSHEIERCLLLGRNVMTNLDSILKSRDITFPTKVCLVKAITFPGVMYGCESWTIKKLSTEELMLLNCDVGEDS